MWRIYWTLPSLKNYLISSITLEYLIAVLSRTSFLGDFPWHTLLLDTSRFSKFYYVEKKNFAFWKIGNFSTRNISDSLFMCIIRNENRQKKKKLFIHNIFGDFCDSCNFGYFRKNPRNTLIRCPHDFRFFMIFPQSRLLDAHGY